MKMKVCLPLARFCVIRFKIGGEKALFRAVFKPRFRWGNIKTLTRPENALQGVSGAFTALS